MNKNKNLIASFSFKLHKKRYLKMLVDINMYKYVDMKRYLRMLEEIDIMI